MDNTATIQDAWKRHTITGNLVKRYPNGITIDDERGIRHYASNDRIISQPTGPVRMHQQMDLF